MSIDCHFFFALSSMGSQPTVDFPLSHGRHNFVIDNTVLLTIPLPFAFLAVEPALSQVD